MSLDRLQTQRFELKFQVHEALALAVRHHVRALLEPDDFGGTPEAPSYPVHSLYLDSDDLQLYHATINGDRNRFKLRIRYYDERPDSPAYVEIKRRLDRCIQKQRARVRRDALPALMAGAEPCRAHLVADDPRQFAALEAFCQIVKQLGAKPRAHVAYDREAWLSAEHNNVRVTLDRHVRCEPQLELKLRTAFARPQTVFEGNVVLELKFTDRYPRWLSDMVRGLGLTQSSAAKYVDGVNLGGPEAFGGHNVSARHRALASRCEPDVRLYV